MAPRPPEGEIGIVNVELKYCSLKYEYGNKEENRKEER
jgi:hypothetical protein